MVPLDRERLVSFPFCRFGKAAEGSHSPRSALRKAASGTKKDLAKKIWRTKDLAKPKIGRTREFGANAG
jgi:hypothetical protein